MFSVWGEVWVPEEVKLLAEDIREINLVLDIRDGMEKKGASFPCIENYRLVGFLI
jgi:hypothetical protein